MTKRRFGLFVIMSMVISLCGAAQGQTAGRQQRQRDKDVGEINVGLQLTDREIVCHVLNRLAFGPRPGQVEQVLAMGWEKWTHQQLDPTSIADDEVKNIAARQWPALYMTMGDVFRAYSPRPLPEDTELTHEEIKQRRDEFYAGQAKVCRQVVESVMHRAVYSNRQFNEVIVEFWRNHFNIDQYKEDTGFLAANYEQQVIRKYAFGKFEDLLRATAHHPAMLIYLDNIVSQKPLNKYEQRKLARYEGRARRPRSIESLARHRGLNENYARELMELHTLGVDNGYTQRDVTELSRILTGWSAGWEGDQRPAYFAAPIEGEFGFVFRKDVHDFDAKKLLGMHLRRRGGVKDGDRIIARLAAHPNTARFISWKLCRYLVRDEPDAKLVEQVANVFRKTNGDLRKVYEAIIFSDDFLYRQNYRCKFKTPFEYVISALRGTGAKIDAYDHTFYALVQMGQKIYGCIDPTGYYDQAEAWLDPGVLVYRWNYAVGLNYSGVGGVKVPAKLRARFTKLDGENQINEVLVATLLPGGLDPRTEKLIRKTIRDYGSIEYALAVVLGSPSFQQQ